MYFFLCTTTFITRYKWPKAIEVTDILFDAGFESREEAMSFGVLPGDTIVPYAETVKTANGKISSVNLGIIVTAVQWS